MSLQQLVKKHNISEEIKNINESLLKECFEQRELFDPHKLPFDNNFELNSKHTNFLYNIFYQISNKHLNKFHLTDINLKLWCYISDQKFHRTEWHNHLNTTTINSVLYLKTQNKGIFFRFKDEEIYISPNDGDILIFPSFLEHLPEVSTTEPRVTINLEFRCLEPSEQIFKIKI
jgi:hypothetical protein